LGLTERWDRAERAIRLLEAPNFDVYALRYATREVRHARGAAGRAFYGHDPHDGPLDYFVGAAVSSDSSALVKSTESFCRSRFVGVVLSESHQHGERAAETESTSRLREEAKSPTKKAP
jgi:hypothetical protein